MKKFEKIFKDEEFEEDVSSLPTTYTNLPGLKNVKVIDSEPVLIKDNSSKPMKKKK